MDVAYVDDVKADEMKNINEFNVSLGYSKLRIYMYVWMGIM